MSMSSECKCGKSYNCNNKYNRKYGSFVNYPHYFFLLINSVTIDSDKIIH